MKLTLATQKDIGQAMAFINQAKAFLKQNGVDQWQNGYPNQESVEKDVEHKRGYLCIHQERAMGYLCIDFNGEPAYSGLDGTWLSEQPYVVVHRMALDDSQRGQGLATSVFQAVEEMAKARQVLSFKVDTDENNEVMKHLLQKNGFQYCGTICFDNSTKIAFEKILE